jgi:hypothetical protein
LSIEQVRKFADSFSQEVDGLSNSFFRQPFEKRGGGENAYLFLGGAAKIRRAQRARRIVPVLWMVAV